MQGFAVCETRIHASTDRAVVPSYEAVLLLLAASFVHPSSLRSCAGAGIRTFPSTPPCTLVAYFFSAAPIRFLWVSSAPPRGRRVGYGSPLHVADTPRLERRNSFVRLGGGPIRHGCCQGDDTCAFWTHVRHGRISRGPGRCQA